MQSILLDIRSPAEYAAGHLPDSILIPTALPPDSDWKLTERYLWMVMYGKPAQVTIYVYCKKGVRAGHAANILRRMGYTNVVSLGGVEEGALALDLQTGRRSLVH